MRSRTAPASPVRVVLGRFQPNEEQQYAAGDVGGPAIEREVRALALDLERLVHAAVEHDVAAGEERPGRAGVERPCRRPARGACAVSGHLARSVTRSTPKSVLSPHSSARTPGPTASARRNASRLRFLARSVVRALAVAASTSRDGVGRPLDAQRGEDRVGLPGDQLEGVVAGARPGEDVGDLLARGGRRGRAELGDRHDRHIGRRTGRGGRHGR